MSDSEYSPMDIEADWKKLSKAYDDAIELLRETQTELNNILVNASFDNQKEYTRALATLSSIEEFLK